MYTTETSLGSSLPLTTPFFFKDTKEELQKTQRSLYVEIRIHCFLLDCLGKQPGADFKGALHYYKEFPKENHLVGKQWLKILRGMRGFLEEQLYLSLPSEHAQSFLKVQNNLHLILDSIEQFGDVDPKLLGFCEEEMESLYHQIKSDILIVYRLWESVLQNKIDELPKFTVMKLSEKVRWFVETRRLIFETKEDFFKRGLKKAYIRETHELKQVRSRVRQHEKKLLFSPDRSFYYLCLIYETLLNSWYFQKADFLIESQERITVAHQWGALSTPLPSKYRYLSKIITSCSLIAHDLMHWKWTGISVKLPLAMTYQFRPSFVSWNPICNYIGVNEKVAICTLHLLHQMIQAACFIGFNKYFSSRSVIEITMSYLILNTAACCTEKCIYLFYRVKHANPMQCSSYPLVKGLVEWLSFPLLARYLMPYVWEQWNVWHAIPENVLIDELSCRSYPLLCKQKACHFLGLAEHASPKEIRFTFRQLAKTVHPDKGGSASAFYLLEHATALCLSKNF